MLLTCSNLSCRIGAKVVLEPIDCIAESCELIAVIGPSGSGKTTFLEALAGRIRSPKVAYGDFTLNGVQVNAQGLNKQCRYLTRKECLLPYLTVQETFETVARLTLPELTFEERSQRIDGILNQLGIFKCRHTLIGGELRKGLSSGEQRRVQIGILLLANPKVLVLDEPTTGLDTYSTLQLMFVLKKLAQAGGIIICSLQQSSSAMLSMVDSVIALVQGNLIYHGKIEHAREHFSHMGLVCPEGYNSLNYILGLVDWETDMKSVISPSVPFLLSPRLFHNSTEQHELNAENSLSSPMMPLYESLSSVNQAPISSQNQFEQPLNRIPLSVLVQGFKQSQTYFSIKERIQEARRNETQLLSMESSVILNDSSSTPSKQQLVLTYVDILGNEISTLSMRFFKNNIRCPIVYCLIFLMHLVQGLFLGFIFWNVMRHVKTQEPWNLNSVSQMNKSWHRFLFQHALENQPFLDTLNMGVDGNLSQPILNLFSNANKMNFGQSLVSCASIYQEFLDQYPWFNIGVQNDWEAPERLRRSTFPREVLYNFLVLSQTADYMKTKANQVQSSSQLWPTMYMVSRESVLNPYKFCMKKLGVFSSFSKQSNAMSFSHRQLLPLSDISLYDLVYSTLGPSVPRILYAIRHYVQNMARCTHTLCEAIRRKTDQLGTQWYNFLGTLGSLLNVCGCLFFLTATLGFSSFDALLTFPQERYMFLRETSNGLYMTLSYFIAKNLADLPFQIFPSFAFVTVFYFMAGLGQTFSHYVLYIIACMGITFAAYGFEYFISSLCSSTKVALLTAPLCLVVWLTLVGFLLREELIPFWLQWFCYFNFYKWGFFCLIINQFPLISHASFGVLPNAVPRLVSGVLNVSLLGSLFKLYAVGFLFRLLAFWSLAYSAQREQYRKYS